MQQSSWRFRSVLVVNKQPTQRRRGIPLRPLRLCVERSARDIAGRKPVSGSFRFSPGAFHSYDRGMKQIVSSPDAPPAIGPYSQAVIANGFVFLSGQIPIDAAGKLVEGDIAAQTEQVFKNLSAVLTAAGSGLDRVVKTTVYLKDMDDFAQMNEVYARCFPADKPARA